MGWTCVHKPRKQSVIDVFRQEFESGGSRGRILDGVATLTEAYLAWQNPDGTVVAIVCLLQYRKQEYYNFCYKEMSEGAGHGLCHCPARILDLLTPTDDPGALAWRKSCRDYHAGLQDKCLRSGEIIRFTQPLRFRSGIELDLFVYEPQGRRHLFRSPATNRLYSIPNYKESDWTRECY